jgi:PIN domain nuclease of toxin-antitoxin system
MLSSAAQEAIGSADELAVSSVTWYELAWLGQRGRLYAGVPIRAWLQGLAHGVRTLESTPEIAATAAALPDSFPRDPADRIIYATAIEEGLQLVTKDERLRSHPYSRQITIW